MCDDTPRADDPPSRVPIVRARLRARGQPRPRVRPDRPTPPRPQAACPPPELLRRRLLGETRSMQHGFEQFRSYPTIGDFLAYQFITDINYSEITDFNEMDFVVAGPGARDGLRKCFLDPGGLSDSDLIHMVADFQEQEFERLGPIFKAQFVNCMHFDRLPGTSGGWIMDVKGFQVWLSAARGLTRAQRREALAVLSGRSEGEASKAAIELGWTRPGVVRTARARGRFRVVWRGVCGATSARAAAGPSTR